MNLRILFYFCATFFASFGAGVSDVMTREQWIRLVVLSLAAGCASVRAFLDQTPSSPSNGGASRGGIVAIAAAFLFSGCSITVYGPNGKPQLRSYANTKGLRWRGPGTSLDIQEADLSTPTKAATAGVTSAITAAGAAAAGLR